MSSGTAKQKEPVRLFKSDFLEAFSHISPVAVAAIWTPVFFYFLLQPIISPPNGVPLYYVPIALFIGWFLWTFIEYTLHRFLFHYHPKTERLKRLFFIMHGVHHAQPLCKTRLVMPPVLSIPLALIFYGIFHLVLVTILGIPHWLPPMFAGVVGGYLVYDMLHYGIHHVHKQKGFVAACRRHHLQHHGACPGMRFGVTFPLWDYVFGTMPKKRS